MNAFAYGWGELLPGTWYLTARIDQTIRGTPVDLSWKPLLILATFAIGLAGLAAWRLVSMRSSARPIDARSVPGPLAEVPS
jgi:ABC-2 type transport system permease protein